MEKTVTKLKLVKGSPSPLARLVDDYLADARAAGLSPKTIKFGYGYPLKSVFLPWAADNGIDSIDQLTSNQLNHLSAQLMDRGLAKSSVWTYLKAVKRLLAWATEQGETVNATAKLPKLDQRLVQVLSRAEVDKLEAAATNIRDAIIIRLLASTGMRRGELVALKVGDLREKNDFTELIVHGKGGLDRLVPLEPKLARRLRKYIGGRPDKSAIFVALRRQDGSYEPLSESGVTQMVTNLGELAGLDKHVTPHLMRHSMITDALKHKMDSLLVAKIVGHRGLQMIQRVYSHLVIEDEAKALLEVLRAADD